MLDMLHNDKVANIDDARCREDTLVIGEDDFHDRKSET
jgi:hypothetical protein